MAQSGDRTPPHDDELERAALGSLLQDADAVAVVNERHLGPADFYIRANQRIFEAVKRLDEKGLRPDIQTVVQELRQSGKLDEAGGAAYVSSLTTVIPSSANIDYYVESIRNYSLRRELLKFASEIAVQAYDVSSDSRIMLEKIQQRIFELSDDRKTSSFKKIDEVLVDTIDYIDHVYKTKKPISGIPTGFDRLDQLTTGFQPADFVVIGARPSVGKTALALNMASTISFKQKIPAAFFSLEQPDIALTQRLLASEALVEGNSLRSGFLSTADYSKILDAADKIYETPLYIVDIPNMELLQLRTQARKLRSQLGVEVIFIDYLGLIVHENKYLQRYEQITEISRSLKSLARELNIPIIVLCQLNREAQWEVPSLANLRDSGSIEQDADLVLFLHRESKKGKKTQQEEVKSVPDIIPTDLIIAKQRNGPVGTIKLNLHAKYARFFPVTKEHELVN